MKINQILIGILTVVVMIGCGSPGYLPRVKHLDVDVYGSYIEVKTIDGKGQAKGELIAIDTTQLVVLTRFNDHWKAESIPVSNIKGFKLSYANHKDYGWTIPVFSLAAFTHGVFSLITLPVNLIVTISVAVSAQKSFQYTDKKMDLQKLKMFARFPQGIPPNVNINDITFIHFPNQKVNNYFDDE